MKINNKEEAIAALESTKEAIDTIGSYNLCDDTHAKMSKAFDLTDDLLDWVEDMVPEEVEGTARFMLDDDRFTSIRKEG
jgi:hypothetical protein